MFVLKSILKRGFFLQFSLPIEFSLCMNSLLETYCERSGFTAKKPHQHQPYTLQASCLFLFIHTNRKGFTSWFFFLINLSLGRNFSSPLSRVSTWVSPIKKSGWKGAPKKKNKWSEWAHQKGFQTLPRLCQKERWN